MKPLSLRTRSRRQQNLVRLALALAILVIYVLATMILGLGNAGCFWGTAQMRAFLPALVLFGILVYETRWDGVVRRWEDKVEEKGVRSQENGVSEENSSPTPSFLPPTPSLHPTTPPPTPTVYSNSSPPLTSTPTTTPTSNANLSPTLTPEEAWNASRVIPHNVVPDPVLERDYYALVVQAANGGHLDALLKLSDYARQRGANVEAYYWAAVAQKRGAKGLDGRLGEIRKQWLFNEANGEYENVYEFFPETCGTIARSLLRIACSIDAPYARKRLRDLAALGDANAKIFC